MAPVKEISVVQPKNGPLYQVVEDYIYDKIRTEELRPGQNIGSVDKIARKLNVSIGTVQQSLQTLAAKGVVHRKPRKGTYISNDLGFMSMNHVNGISKVVSLLVPDIRMPEYAQLAKAVQDVMHDLGVDVISASTEDNIETYTDILNRQVESNVFGIILIPPLHAPLPLETIMALRKNQIPVVTCYRELNLTEWPVVMNDTLHTAYTATEHLLTIGRKKISAFDWGGSIEGFSDFHHGYIKALIDSRRCDIEDRWLHGTCVGKPGSSWPESHKVRTEDIDYLFNKYPDTDGVCCSHDCLAAAVIRYLREQGRSVPQDVAVTGSGDMATYFGFGENDITTLAGQCEAMAQKACDMIVQIRQNGFTPEKVHKVKCVLKGGKSTQSN